MAAASEGAVALAGAVPVPLSGPVRRTVDRALLQGAVDVAETPLRATWRTSVRLPAKPDAPGVYVYAVMLQAELNPERRTIFVGHPFRVART
jgi:hypothetical protein